MLKWVSKNSEFNELCIHDITITYSWRKQQNLIYLLKSTTNMDGYFSFEYTYNTSTYSFSDLDTAIIFKLIL